MALNRCTEMDPAVLPAEQLTRLRNLATALKMNAGDSEWMVNVIGSITAGNHPFFLKSFVKPARAKVKIPIVIQGDGALFDDLPMSKGKMSKGVIMKFMNPAEREAYKMEVL